MLFSCYLNLVSVLVSPGSPELDFFLSASSPELDVIRCQFYLCCELHSLLCCFCNITMDIFVSNGNWGHP